MKKNKMILKVLCLLIFTNICTYATNQDSKNFVNDFKDSKELLMDLKKKLPDVYMLVNDYFEAKTCKKDYWKIVSKDDIQDYVSSLNYGTLIGFKYAMGEKFKAYYSTLINAYRFMNCSENKSFEKFLISTEAISEIQEKK